jgi:thymidylate synthase
MTISLIACVDNKFGIGKDNDLLYHIDGDMKYFKNITTNSKQEGNAKAMFVDRNIVVMGRTTWFSIPNMQRPLPGRVNVVLPNDKHLHKLSPYPWKIQYNQWLITKHTLNNNIYYMTYNQFKCLYKLTNANVFVIGGGEIYKMFMNDDMMKPSNIYLTQVWSKTPVSEPDTFLEPLTSDYELTRVSEKMSYKDGHYMFLKYHKNDNYVTDEDKYLNLCTDVLTNGTLRTDRTEVGTFSVFGRQISFDISETVPLFTTKRVPWKSVIEELLWFTRGDTDAKILQKNGVHIWDGNTSRAFLNSRNLFKYDEGVLGPGYGWQMRCFGGTYDQCLSDTSQFDITKLDGVDQLSNIVNELKTNPFSRRIMLSYWNPINFDQTALLPCHVTVQFYVEETNEGSRTLNCMFTMRSNDLFLGNPFNIFSYTVLTYILAMKCNLIPGKLVYSCGDAHIYKNHVAQVGEQLSRPKRPLPKLFVDPSVKHKDWKDIKVTDFDIVGYFPHPSITAKMAV